MGLNSEPEKTRSLQESRPRKREARATVDEVRGWRKHGAQWQDGVDRGQWAGSERDPLGPSGCVSLPSWVPHLCE